MVDRVRDERFGLLEMGGVRGALDDLQRPLECSSGVLGDVQRDCSRDLVSDSPSRLVPLDDVAIPSH